MNDSNNLPALMEVGRTIAKSGFFQDAREESQAVVKVLAGQELGIGAITAMQGIYIVKGRVAIGANLMAAKIKGSGKYDYRVAELSDKVCTLHFYEGTRLIGESKFTIEDAKRAGTQNLDKFPKNMLFARAMSNGAKWFCPDVFTGITPYTREELNDEGATVEEIPVSVDTATGEVLEGEIVKPAEPAPTTNGKRTTSREKIIEGIVADWDARAVYFPEFTSDQRRVNSLKGRGFWKSEYSDALDALNGMSDADLVAFAKHNRAQMKTEKAEAEREIAAGGFDEAGGMETGE